MQSTSQVLMPAAVASVSLDPKGAMKTGGSGESSNANWQVSPSAKVDMVPAVPRGRWIALLGIPVSSRNQGVQALGATLVDLCMKASAGVRIRVLVGNSQPQVIGYRVGGSDHMVPVVNFRLSPRALLHEHLAWIVLMALCYKALPFAMPRRLIARSTPWIEALERSAFAGDIRGGDSFSDIYGMRRFVIGFLAAWSVLLVKGSIVQFPQTYGPFKSRVARAMARFLLRRSSVIMARDKSSLRVAQELVGAAREILLSPDVAFALEATCPEHLIVDPSLTGGMPAGIVGVNVNGLMYHGGYSRNNMFGLKMDYPGFLRSLLLALLAEQAQEVWLVPHVYAPAGDVESDPDASHHLRDSLPLELQKRVRIVAGEYDTHQIKGVIGMSDFFIGSRMHSCIAALSQGVPCVGVAYSMKFRGVFESVGLESWVVDGREVNADEAVVQVMDLYRHREDERSALRKSAACARQRLVEVFKDMMEKLGFQTGEWTTGGQPRQDNA
ncbi:MAG: polysaccharide pyruvyl transferase family protein [Verrucomicrobiota bacterium]